jgi:UDP-N-acetylmuramate--alanine ligase
VHFIAIGGAGMSGIAALFARRGVRVSGSDREDSPVLDELRALGISIFVGHDVANLGDVQTVVVSSAIREDNVELAAARQRGLRVWHRSVALAALMFGHTGVAITGTHGKTTTSALAAQLLDAAGLEPSWVLGAPLAKGSSAKLGAGDPFVIEADESDGSYLQYDASIVCVTNIESDHLDNWLTDTAYRAGFLLLAGKPGVTAVVASADDPGARDFIVGLSATGKKVVTFGEAEDADVRLSEFSFAGAGSDAVITAEGDTGPVHLEMPGKHNLYNFAAAYAIGRLLGVPGSTLREAASGLVGARRRFQILGAAAGVRVVDDYAHHPTEIVAALKAARRYAGVGRVIACFQPHLFTRTRDFATELGDALAFADGIVVTDIYPAREDPIPGVTGKLVADAASRTGGPVVYVQSLAEVPQILADLAHAGDVVMTIGAGSITHVGPELLAILDAKA